jgi:hypothetical protein
MLTRQHWFRTGGTVLGVISLVGAGSAPDGRATKISGRAELTYSKRDAVEVPGGPGHTLTVGETRGINHNTGPTDFMADARAVNVEMADLTQGNGRHQGYYTMVAGADTTVAKWSGQVTTTVSKEGEPNTTFAGTWKYVHGSGRYAGIRGGGTYKGQFLAKDRYTVSWEGARRD